MNFSESHTLPNDIQGHCQHASGVDTVLTRLTVTGGLEAWAGLGVWPWEESNR